MPDTYTNPVYPHTFPDPFVLKWCGEYWAYCTGQWHDGRCFGVLRSRDLVEWEEWGGALAPLPGDLPHYWAPEVSQYGGRFFMYYSAGVELEDMAVRVAVADHPAGPFVDAGLRLTREAFAIDPHVFVDDDGARYLFYATDYLDHTYVGTGTAVDRMTSPFALAGEPRPVTRARFDWQVYDPQRAEKGGVRWHTVEGSFVLKRKRRYYQMFSGGNWQNVSYGVSYATSDRVVRDGEWDQHADGSGILPILRTIPGRVVGPGHNSAVRGPDNRQLYAVYHRWVAGERTMAIDPLDWAGERMLALGPSDEPRPAPAGPAVADFFDDRVEGGLGPAWELEGGRWSAGEGEAVQEGTFDTAAARCRVGGPCFLAEVSVRALVGAGREPPTGSSSYGLSLEGAGGTQLYLLLAPEAGSASVLWRAEDGWREEDMPLPAEFDPSRFQLLRVEADGRRVRAALPDSALAWEGRCAGAVDYLALRTSGHAAAFAGFALTVGYEDRFETDGPPEEHGWQPLGGAWQVAGGALRCAAGESVALKPRALADGTLVVNARALDGAGYRIWPAATAEDLGPQLAVEPAAGGWEALWRGQDLEQRIPLPEGFAGAAEQQWRLVRRGGRVRVAWEQHDLGEFEAPAGPAGVALGGPAAFEMVRVTADARRDDRAGAI